MGLQLPMQLLWGQPLAPRLHQSCLGVQATTIPLVVPWQRQPWRPIAPHQGLPCRSEEIHARAHWLHGIKELAAGGLQQQWLPHLAQYDKATVQFSPGDLSSFGGLQQQCCCRCCDCRCCCVPVHAAWLLLLPVPPRPLKALPAVFFLCPCCCCFLLATTTCLNV